MQTNDPGHAVEPSKLFDRQIAMLSRRGCPPRIIDKLLFQKSDVIFATSPSESYIPFIPVIPQGYLTTYSQMGLLRNNDARGQTLLNLSDFEDLDITPQEPYYICGVDRGDTTLLLRTDSRIVALERRQEAEIKEQGRYCLTIVEAIAIALHTDILQDCLVRPLASKFGTFLYLRANGVPVLETHPEDAFNDWCIPSYAFRRCYIK